MVVRLIRLVFVALVCVSLGFVGLSPAAAKTKPPKPEPIPIIKPIPLTCAPVGAQEWKPETWMGDLFNDKNCITTGTGTTAASNITLRQLAIPGSHDSATYEVHGGAEECGYNWTKSLAPDTARRWARAQHHNLNDQAKLGVRSFDIRPYWNGKELRTCHTVDTASLKDVFTNPQTGLNNFAKDHPQETMIINLSDFKTGDNNNTPRWHDAIDEMAWFLAVNVCPYAVNPNHFGNRAGDVTLNYMRGLKKSYVVIADNRYDLYDGLMKKGPAAGTNFSLDNCVFRKDDNVSGGYAGEDNDVRYPAGNENGVDYPGGYSSTNLWLGLMDENDCRHGIAVIKSCEEGKGMVTGDTVRRATEHKLIFDIKNDKERSLHETSYIWAYGIFDGGRFDSHDTLDIVGMPHLSLIGATEDKKVWTEGRDFKAGLLPYAKDFINRLQSSAQTKNRNVNIVNMDAIGRGNKTKEQFITPLMDINKELLTS